MSSSTCRSLNSPHVCLQMNVSESRGDSKTHNIEMTLGEFQVSYQHLFLLLSLLFKLEFCSPVKGDGWCIRNCLKIFISNLFCIYISCVWKNILTK